VNREWSVQITISFESIFSLVNIGLGLNSLLLLFYILSDSFSLDSSSLPRLAFLDSSSGLYKGKGKINDKKEEDTNDSSSSKRLGVQYSRQASLQT
jgi:hypothetical protein